MAYFFLTIAIITEIFGTTLLKASAGFSKLLPFIFGILLFSISLYFMTLSFKTIPLGIGYAIWSGVGTAGAAILGILIWKEKITIFGLLGMLLIVMGIILLNVPTSKIESV